MTTRHIALLRGINVGGHRRITMGQQRDLALGLGLTDVTVHLQTGNLVFSAPEGKSPAAIAAELADRLAAEVGGEVPVTVRTRDELAAELAANPYPEAAAAEPKSVHCLFLSAAPADTEKLDALDGAAFAPDSFHLLGRVIYLHTPTGFGRSRLAGKLTSIRLPGVFLTARNWNTAGKLLEIADS
ncbi:DUF1697 domain-containing protein [Streptomyces specialis]|uniref:DUF1697 domain-containing protein n=1 Tax=Streptomyces specialis TaxID=498367 RepID=UPI00073ED72A|nr:DUF1697 domain-containing protein [Streptomyces specialis]